MEESFDFEERRKIRAALREIRNKRFSTVQVTVPQPAPAPATQPIVTSARLSDNAGLARLKYSKDDFLGRENTKALTGEEQFQSMGEQLSIDMRPSLFHLSGFKPQQEVISYTFDL